ncbi:hypothetical protein FisN_15Lu056 [Fistulifera solaris]|uniref:Uncharacterized protein n=1 Tax=Fistulifera solaris TaxID=1519565 RepID=A0A1Z5KHZ0_FISSO|nr:hypothetical protein FisN_15Lu056 [Fistulifera solaris]|eukprot:GAX25661.1 hypothetical protein FisN_15Lu056 [Fistulifera solaris]
MISIIKTNKTFASFVLFTCILSSPVGRIGCFFAPAEIQFALEIGIVLRNSASVQSLSESVCVYSCVCLLVLSLCIIVVPACVAGLELMRFCARTVAEIALLALKSFCSTAWLLFGRRAAVCFVLLHANSCAYREDVLLAKNTEFPGRLETPPRLTMLRPVAPVREATGKQFDLKRNHCVVFRVSFVFIFFLVVIGVVTACICGGARWIGASAVGLFLLLAERRGSSAATRAIHIARLGNLETSRSFAPDRIRLLREFRCGSILNMQQSASNQEVQSLRKKDVVVNNARERTRRRVRFASKENQESLLIIENCLDMSDDEFHERYWSSETFNQRRDESSEDRDFEIFKSHEFFDERFYFLFSTQTSVMFTEEVFFLDHEGERRHPAHWKGFCTRIRPHLQKDREIPGFPSVDAYENYLRFYDKLYRTCITWYDNNLWRTAGVLIPEPVPENESLESDSNIMEDMVDGSGVCDAVALADERFSVHFVVEECEDIIIHCDVVEDSSDSGVVQRAAVEEHEAEGRKEAAAFLPRKMKKMKAFGPCFRSRPFLKRKCKENVRYSK